MPFYPSACARSWPVPRRSLSNALSRTLVRTLLIATALVSCSVNASPDDLVPNHPQARWWKGNLHTHSLWSDGDDFPEMIAEWYRTNGYNFLALSDHNVLSEGQRWMPLSQVKKRGESSLEKYLKRFGPDWVELRDNADSPSSQEVRLKPLNEFRALVETRGTFIMLAGEEISDSVDNKPLHMNATNLRDLLQPLGGETMVDAARANLRAADYQAKELGREILVHINHPNFGYAITPQQLAEILEEQFFEVYNGHPGVNQLGDAERPSIERMWDIANTIRLTKLGGDALLGIATDDSHDYHDDNNSNATTGRGWVMVRATHLTPESLIRAMKRGDVYASSGVSLDNVAYDASKRRLSLTIIPDGDATFTTQFIGSRFEQVNGERTATPAQTGIVLATSNALEPHYQLQGDELYVRAVVTSSKPHTNPSFEAQMKQAWTQPVGWQREKN